ncbi:MAG: radical SAM protein, partial [Deltaproteobacteria bacterium]|nr:radical SAM protein [Deltaproteobacteria bacterium]
MTFESYLSAQPLEAFLREAEGASPARVERALETRRPDFGDYLALLSPGAAGFLEPLAERARQITRERFGRVIQLYAPMYVSNECTNSCVYCGFNRTNAVQRITLSPAEVEAEAAILWAQGFRDLLLVSGEAPGRVPVSFFLELASRLGPRFPSLSAEIYPLSGEDYARLAEAGIDGLTVFQETYDR